MELGSEEFDDSDLMFQYNYCFGGTTPEISGKSGIFCFNTTIVSVERKELCWDKVICEFQYNYCFGGTQGTLLG